MGTDKSNSAANVATPEKEEQVSSSSRRRRERQPLGTPRLKMSVSPRLKEIFAANREVPRWINDDPGRLEEAAEADSFRFVDKSEIAGIPIPIGEGDQIVANLNLGSKVSMVVGSRRDGSPVTAYLMAKPIEDVEEDQRAKRAAIDQKELAMKRGKTEQVENMYIPSTGIKIESGGKP